MNFTSFNSGIPKTVTALSLGYVWIFVVAVVTPGEVTWLAGFFQNPTSPEAAGNAFAQIALGVAISYFLGLGFISGGMTTFRRFFLVGRLMPSILAKVALAENGFVTNEALKTMHLLEFYGGVFFGGLIVGIILVTRQPIEPEMLTYGVLTVVLAFVCLPMMNGRLNEFNRFLEEFHE